MKIKIKRYEFDISKFIDAMAQGTIFKTDSLPHSKITIDNDYFNFKHILNYKLSERFIIMNYEELLKLNIVKKLKEK